MHRKVVYAKRQKSIGLVGYCRGLGFQISFRFGFLVVLILYNPTPKHISPKPFICCRKRSQGRRRVLSYVVENGERSCILSPERDRNSLNTWNQRTYALQILTLQCFVILSFCCTSFGVFGLVLVTSHRHVRMFLDRNKEEYFRFLGQSYSLFFRMSRGNSQVSWFSIFVPLINWYPNSWW